MAPVPNFTAPEEEHSRKGQTQVGMEREGRGPWCMRRGLRGRRSTVGSERDREIVLGAVLVGADGVR